MRLLSQRARLPELPIELRGCKLTLQGGQALVGKVVVGLQSLNAGLQALLPLLQGGDAQLQCRLLTLGLQSQLFLALLRELHTRDPLPPHRPRTDQTAALGYTHVLLIQVQRGPNRLRCPGLPITLRAFSFSARPLASCRAPLYLLASSPRSLRAALLISLRCVHSSSVLLRLL